MWGVFSSAGYLLGSFHLFCAAVDAYRRWPQATQVARIDGCLLER